MKIVTGRVSGADIVDEVPEIASLLRANGIEDVIVEHGWGSNLNSDQMWKPISLKAANLPSFVKESIERGVFSPGNSDLSIRDADRTVEFRLCHESDLHLVTDNTSLLEQTSSHWRKKFFKVNPSG